MKDQYVGDVNDYVKYGFLRALSAARAGPLVVCWMLTPSDEGPDGGKVGYLGQPGRYRSGDTELFDALGDLVRAGRRSVEAVEQAELLPGASFLSPVVSDGADQRRELFEQLQRQAPEDALVFFDPDNGLEVKSKPRGRRDSSKYVFWDEIEATAQPGRSVVIYQHYSRTPRDLMVSGLIAELERRLRGHRAFALRSPHVAYLVAARADEAACLAEATAAFARRWPGGLATQPNGRAPDPARSHQ